MKSSAAQLHLAAVGQVATHPFSLVQGGRHHVDLQDVGPAVVVEVGDIDAHAGEARVLEPAGGLIGERSVSVVDVQDIVGRDVVRDIDVGPPVAVDVADHNAEPISELAENPRFAGNVGKRAVAVVAIQLVVTAGVPAADAGRACFLTTRKVVGRVVQQKQVEVAVAVVVEEDGVGGEARIGDPVPCGRFREGVIPVVDEQQIGPLFGLGPFGSGNGDVNIQVPVVVDVHHGGAGGPAVCGDARGLRDVFEPHVALVHVQAARDHVAREENVR